MVSVTVVNLPNLGLGCGRSGWSGWVNFFICMPNLPNLTNLSINRIYIHMYMSK